MKVLLLAILLSPLLSEASTFIGNGGNAGDIEKEVTRRQILGSLKGIKSKEFDQENLCLCSKPFNPDLQLDWAVRIHPKKLGHYESNNIT